MSRYVVEQDVCGGWSVYYSGNTEAPPISHHNTPKDAREAIKRYEAGDRHRGTTRRSGADVINDLTR
jgi:hypothetical protein